MIYGQKTNHFEIKQGNTSPFLETVLLDVDGPVDLTTADHVELRMVLCRHPRTVVLNDVVTDFVADATGTVWYEWQTGDTDTPGKYEIEWTVVYPTGLIVTFPSLGHDIVDVTKRL